jgi:hypothetical protein
MDWADGEQDRVYFGIGNHLVASFGERLSYTAAGVNCGWALMGLESNGVTATRWKTTMTKAEE